MMVGLSNNWGNILMGEFDKPYYKKLREILVDEYKSRIIYPNKCNIFTALNLTDYDDVKAVVLGQDPYINPNQAQGLAFSVNAGISPPPSLINIYREMESDLNITINKSNGDLTYWANQGVLLLNTTLTVRAGESNSHSRIGWSIFTDQIIKILNDRVKPIVFILWGANAKSKIDFITNPNHLVLTAAHPSPLSAYKGFFGCKHFSQTNAFLKQHGIEPILWERL